MAIGLKERLRPKFRFKSFKVYQEAKEYCGRAHGLVQDRIARRDRGLADQIERALNSVVLNIAEGSADNSDTEFARFLAISIRSLYETVAGFDLAAHYGYVDESTNGQIEEEAYSLVKQLASFRNTLRKEKATS